MIELEELKRNYTVINHLVSDSKINATYDLFTLDKRESVSFPIGRFVCHIEINPNNSGEYRVLRYNDSPSKYVSDMSELQDIINEYVRSLRFNSDNYYLGFSEESIILFKCVREYMEELGFTKSSDGLNDTFEYNYDIYDMPSSVLKIYFSMDDDTIKSTDGYCYINLIGFNVSKLISIKSKADIDSIIRSINSLLSPFLVNSVSKLYNLMNRIDMSEVSGDISSVDVLNSDSMKDEIIDKLESLLKSLKS